MDVETQESIFEKELNIVSIFLLFIRNKGFIITISSIFAIASIFIALSIQPIFTSTIVLKSVQENEPSLSAGLGVLSGISNISGSLGLNPDEEAILAMKHAVSKDFFKTLYLNEDFKKNLMAYDIYNPEDKSNLYNETIFDSNKNIWIVEPIFLNAHKKFTTQHMTILQEKIGGFVNISIEHQSPVIAKDWAEFVYKELNKYMKEISVEKNTKAEEYLKSELNKTRNAELSKVISSLLESKIQKQMYADISDDYIFSVVDSAYVPHERSRPSRAFICIVITALGFFLSCLIIFILAQFNRKIQLRPPFVGKID